MKQLIFISVVFLVLSATAPVLVFAQQPSPQWFLLVEEVVAPSHQKEFMKVQKEAVELWHKHNLDVPIYAHETDVNSIYWVVPIDNFASLDAVFQKTSEFSKKARQEGYNGSEKFRDLSTISQSIMMWDPELSYHPNDSFGAQGKDYKEWMLVYLHSGHEEEAARSIKRYIDFYSKNNTDYPWDTFRVLFGQDTPALILMKSAKDPVTLHSLEAEIREKYSEDLDALWNEFASHVRKIDHKTGRFNPGLSHWPQ